MKFTSDREKLLHAFQTAAMAAPSRSPKPILQNVKLEVTAETATLMATDLDIGVRIEVSGFEIEVPGTAVLPIDRFGAILRESSDAKLLVETDGNGTRIRGKGSDFRFPAANPDEFPAVAAFDSEKYHEMPARFFRELIHRTEFATDTESSRYALGGVLLELTGDAIIGVGTDGRRLARQDGPASSVQEHGSGESTTIVPARSMKFLERALADNDENIRLSIGENSILVQSQRTTIYSKLVEGRYPRWREVFPSGDDAARIELAVGPFHAAVRQAAIVLSGDRRGVDFTFGGGKVLLTASGAEQGESRIELPIAYDEADIAITLDARYFMDFLRVLDADQTFTLQVKDADNPAVALTDDGYSYVIMPLTREQQQR